MNFKREKYIYRSIVPLVAKILLLSSETTLNYRCMYESEKKLFKLINYFRFPLSYLQLSTCE